MSLIVADRPGPPNSITFESGARIYLIGDERYWSVTSALKGVEKEGLVHGAGYAAADAALADVTRIAVAVKVDPCGRSYSKCKHPDGDRSDCCPCWECQTCARRWIAEAHIRKSVRRSDEGIRAHKFVDWWANRDGEQRGYDDDIAPYVRAFLAFIERYGLTPESFLVTERTGVNKIYRYAGTLDAIIRFRARATPEAAKLVARVLGITAEAAIATDAFVDLLVDFKTAEKIDAPFRPEHALQTAPYRRFTGLLMKGFDDEEPMPATNGAGIALLRPDEAVFRPVVTDDAAFTAFLHYLRGFEWVMEHGNNAILIAAFPLLKEPKPEPKRRARAKKPPIDETPAA
ncbi:hypothetical protein I0C86_41670 [Plantactinospora sp. S1510]|uniref:Uncharacterized protein n=1 Tax=Plantactinospora alkalitolerans TaxID=2789879 RepID=A0ABS0HA54_9ACTN|nr:hypothetical protein [Plantactinospora alkalitolerans]MBF9135363.1 hypothetical protein [Plantactinospora alkalitolerans]